MKKIGPILFCISSLLILASIAVEISINFFSHPTNGVAVVSHFYPNMGFALGLLEKSLSEIHGVNTGYFGLVFCFMILSIGLAVIDRIGVRKGKLE